MDDGRISRRGFLQRTAGAAGGAFMIPIFVDFPAQTRRAYGAEDIRLTLPWIPEGEVAFMYVAQKRGFWANRGLNVSITRGHGSGEAAKTVGLGQYDFGQADMGVMMNSVGKGLKLVSIGVVNHKSPLCIVSRRELGIKSPRDLEGKKLGQAPGSGDAVLWPAFAAINKIDVKKVTIVNVAGDVLTQSFLNKSVDAFGSFYQSSAPYLWADKVDFNIMLYSDHGMDLYGLTFMTQPDRINRKQEQARQFVEGVMEGLKFSYLHPEESLDIFLSSVPETGKSPRDREIAGHSLAINTALGLVDYVQQNGLGWHKQEIVANTQNTVVKYMGLKKAAPVNSLYANDFVGKIKLTKEEWTQTREKVKRYLTT